MTIPKYDEMYRAFLDCLTDGQPHKSKEVKERLLKCFIFRMRSVPFCCPAEAARFLTAGLVGQEPISRRQA